MNLLESILSEGTISLVENNSIIKSKTNKEKVLYKLDKEIELLNLRPDLMLEENNIQSTKPIVGLDGKKSYQKLLNEDGSKMYKKDDNGNLVKRIENRFWNNPKNDSVSFNIKYKGIILRFEEMGNNIFSCKNDIEILKTSLLVIEKHLKNLESTHQFFTQIGEEK